MPHPDMNGNWVNGHPEEGLIHEWLDEQLSAQDAAAVAGHVADCAECSAVVAEARGLIAASHRILSALDDVPANVIPEKAVVAADNTVVDIESARRVEARRGDSAGRGASVWRRYGKIAALLLVAVVPGVVLLRGDDVTIPMSMSAPSNAADSASGITAPMATEAPAIADAQAATASDAIAKSATRRLADSAASGAAATTNQVAKVADRARDAAALSIASRELQRSASEAEPRSQLPNSANRALATLPAVPTPPPASRSEDDRRVSAAASALSDSAKAALTAQAPGAPPANAALPLQGRVAGAQIVTASTPPVAADQVVQSRAMAAGGRGGGRGGGGGGGRGLPARTDSLSSVPIPQLSNSLAATATPITAGFDSITLTRTNCASACETAVLHISALGAVRLSVSSGGITKPVVTSQLSTNERDLLGQVIAATMRETVSLDGALRCTVNRSSGSIELEVLIVGARTNRDRAELPCSTPRSDVLRMGTIIDSMVGTDALRRRIP